MTRDVAPPEMASREEAAAVVVVLALLRARTRGANAAVDDTVDATVDATPAWRFSGRSWGLTPGQR